MADNYVGMANSIAGTVGDLFQAAGPIIGYFMSQSDRDTQQKLIQQATDQFGNIDVPRLQALVVKEMGPSAFEAVRDDAEYRAQQQAADAQLNDVINQGGLTLADKAALAQIQQRLNQQSSAQRQGILQNAAARGQMGSGAQMAAQLQNQQQSAQQANEAGMNTAGQAQQRALNAILARGQNASGQLSRIQQRDMAKAQAKDAINRFNVTNQNQANMYNAQLPAQQFNLEMQKAQGMYNPLMNQANYYGGKAAATTGLWTGIGNAMGNIAKEPAYASGQYSGNNTSTSAGFGNGQGTPDAMGNTSALGGTAGMGDLGGTGTMGGGGGGGIGDYLSSEELMSLMA